MMIAARQYISEIEAAMSKVCGAVGGRARAAAAIQPRAKDARGKPGAGRADPDGTGARLWALGSPAPRADYGPPWDSVSADLWGRLLGALADPEARRIAAGASRLGYAECVKALLGGAPAVCRALMDIRGLADAAAPKNRLPGEPLVYELL